MSQKKRKTRTDNAHDGGVAVPRAILPPGASLTDPWEVALSPIGVLFEDDATARPLAIVIASNGLIIHLGLEAHPSSEPEALASLAEGALHEAIAATGVTPGHVQVRHDEIADSLGPRLASRGITVTAEVALPQADDALQAVLDSLGAPSPPAMSYAGTWSAWGLPDDLVARLFVSGARYYRAAPWRLLPDDRVLWATIPGDHPWWVMILGNAGETFGLSLLRDQDDVARMFDPTPGASPFADAEGAIISMTFGRRRDIPLAMSKEIRQRGWELAGSLAIPQLMIVNTPGGGIIARQAETLATVLDVVPRFAEAHRPILAADTPLTTPLTWHDEATGVVITLADGAYEPASPWEVPATLAPSGPEGPGARPGERLEPETATDVTGMVESSLRRFEQWLAPPEAKGVAAAAARRYADDVLPFVDWLHAIQRVPLSAVTEYDLREFLYTTYAQLLEDGRYPDRVPQLDDEAPVGLLAALDRWFAFLDAVEGVKCPWAGATLRDRELFEERWDTRPVEEFDGEAMREWLDELQADHEARLLVPMPDRSLAFQWQVLRGPVELALEEELRRAWLVWRDEEIRGGCTEYRALLPRLLERQRAWARTPDERAGGETPAAAIAREQQQVAQVLAEDDESR